MAFATIDVTKGITGTIPVANGGTGLASGTTGQFIKFTGSTTVASSALGATGKVLQIAYAYKTDASSVSTSSSVADVSALTCSITPSSASNYVYVSATFEGQNYGNGSSLTPHGQVQLLNNSDTVLAKRQYYKNISNNQHSSDFGGVLEAYYNPNTTSQISFNLGILASDGRMLIYGSNGSYADKATSITAMEISA